MLTVRSIYRVHSPFVYKFYTKVLPHRMSDAGKRIEQLRLELCRDQTIISFEDLGAGSRKDKQLADVTTHSISTLARRASRNRRQGELLHRICAHYQPQRCLELGTHLGISALYQHSAIPDSNFVSLEGIPALAERARSHLAGFGLQTRIITGPFDETLNQGLKLAEFQPDYVFIDGNHTYEATVTYFYQLLPVVPDGGIMIFDDIYWSRGMAKAWEEVCAHPEVSVSIDLFYLGICFIRRPQAKEHFRTRLR